MRSAVPLYQFMPYGAPDLLESRQRYLSRALVLTSAMALALVALTGGLASRFPRAPVRPPHQIVIEPKAWEFVTPDLTPPPPVKIERRTQVADDAAAPVAVPDKLWLPPVETKLAGSGEGDVVTNTPPSATRAGNGDAAREALPARGEWVYVEELPVPIREVKPDYPPIALQAGIEGLVVVHVLVGTDGRVRDAVLSEKLQAPMLNQAALDAARQWVFTPGRANGKPVACWNAIPFRFRLH